MKKINKLILICIVLTKILLANNEDIFNTAISYYNNEQYDIAETLLKDLEKKEYGNTLIYFILGKIYRFKEDNINSIKYLEKFLKNPSSEKNEMFAKINLAYEYLKSKKIDDLEKSKKIVDELIQSKFNTLGDVTYCYAIVYNANGFYYLENDIDAQGNLEYYEKTSVFFKTALEKRSELVGVANNLAISYIRIIEILLKNKDKNFNKIKEYAQKTDEILSDSKYSKFTQGKFQDTKNYFYKFYKNYLN